MIGLSNGYKRLWLLIGLANARVKKLVMPENFLEISRHFALTSCCNTIGQSKDALFHIRVFFGGKTKSPYFDLFIHWLIKQIMNTHRNHFSRSYENRSIRVYLDPLYLSNEGHFSWSRTLEDLNIQFQKEKGKFVHVCSCPP